ncbi:MAG TPA: hypothetical protein VH008_04120 [Pseudonocardia sp.]|nr:hypothetical protein [Pseudonocardia sp.]
MPPIDDGRPRPRPTGPDPLRADAIDEPGDGFSPLIDYGTLRGLPVPVQVVVSTALLPFEIAVTSVKILRNTEALLGELVYHLRALRPAVTAASQAYADGHFEPMLKTFDQIQQGTNAIAFVWAPLNAVRDVIIPGPPRQQLPAGAPVRIQRPITPMVPPPVQAAPIPPTTVEWLGELSGRVLDQAATLPGGALFVGSLRRLGQVNPGPPDPEPLPAYVVEEFEEFDDPATVAPPPDRPAELPLLQPVLDRAAPLVPAAVRRLFGRN